MRWGNEYKLIHKDKLKEISEICSIENCLPIEQFGNYVIRLNPDPKKRNQTLSPDWYGYKRIDSHQDI